MKSLKLDGLESASSDSNTYRIALCIAEHDCKRHPGAPFDKMILYWTLKKALDPDEAAFLLFYHLLKRRYDGADVEKWHCAGWGVKIAAMVFTHVTGAWLLPPDRARTVFVLDLLTLGGDWMLEQVVAAGVQNDPFPDFRTFKEDFEKHMEGCKREAPLRSANPIHDV